MPEFQLEMSTEDKLIHVVSVFTLHCEQILPYKTTVLGHLISDYHRIVLNHDGSMESANAHRKAFNKLWNYYASRFTLNRDEVNLVLDKLDKAWNIPPF